MTPAEKQEQTIAELDAKAKLILRYGGDEELLLSLAGKMNTIKNILDSSTKGKLNDYCQRYEGFYRYVRLLEKIAYGVSQGDFDDILN